MQELAFEELTGPGPVSFQVEDESVHHVEVGAVAGHGTVEVSGEAPSMPSRLRVHYDVHDHAVGIDDGSTLVAEVLAPSGRVLRRFVRHRVTNELMEDPIFGYAGPSDSPAYSMPTGGGPVTTYVPGATGLLEVYTGSEGAYTVVNGHGDVVGHTDDTGEFTAVPLADEWGVSDTIAGEASAAGVVVDVRNYAAA